MKGDITAYAALHRRLLGLLRDPVAARLLRRRDLVLPYAALIQACMRRGSMPTTLYLECWGEINEAIIARWSVAGLEYIKKLAWEQAYRKPRRSA